MYEIVNIQMHFSVKLVNILVLIFFYRYVNLGKIFKNEFIYFHFDKVGKNKNGQSWVLLFGTKDDLR